MQPRAARSQATANWQVARQAARQALLRLAGRVVLQPAWADWLRASGAPRETASRVLAALAQCLAGGGTRLSLECIALPPRQPVPDLARLVPRLQELDLTSTGLREVPPSLLGLAHLADLHLPINHIRSLPPDIGRLQALRHLRLHQNPLQAPLPDSLRDCRRLELLDLDDCELPELPVWLGEMASLREIWIAGNPGLADLPRSMAQLNLHCRIHINRTAPFRPADLAWHDGHIDPVVFEPDAPEPEVGEEDAPPLDQVLLAWQVATAPPGAGDGPASAEPARLGRWQAWAGEEGAGAFARWLQRLQAWYAGRAGQAAEPAEAASAGGVPPEVIAGMADVLARMEAHPGFRQACYARAADALGECDDRVALGFSHMQSVLLQHRAAAGELSSEALLQAGCSLFHREVLVEEALRHARGRSQAVRDEELMVVLALEIRLRGRLALPAGVPAMEHALYASTVCGVDEAVADAALQAVRQRCDDLGPDGLWAFLAGQRPWQFDAWVEHLRGRYPRRFNALQAEVDAQTATRTAQLRAQGGDAGPAQEQAGAEGRLAWDARQRHLVRELTLQEGAAQAAFAKADAGHARMPPSVQ